MLLVVIGPNWLSSADPDGRRRLDDPEDNHRREIEAALRRRIRVIPVLVSQAAMPAMHELPESLTTLARRQSFELDTGRWEFDVSRLSATLEKDVGTAGSQAAAESESASATVPARPAGRGIAESLSSASRYSTSTTATKSAKRERIWD